MTLTAAFSIRDGSPNLDIDLSVSAGETLALIGPNGAGKTTTLRAIAGLRGIDSGAITIDGQPVAQAPTGLLVPPERRPIGMVFQQYALFENLDARHNIAFGLRARRVSKAEALRRADEWIERYALTGVGKLRPQALSGGQRQRVALARALILEPRVLLLDEPLAALDAQIRRQVRRDLGRFLAEYDGVRVLVTHDPLDAYGLANRVAVMENGQIVQSGSVAEVTAHPRSTFVADMVGTNVLYGVVDRNGFHTGNDTGNDVVLPIVADFDGPAWMNIRPTSITLSTSLTPMSARIVVRGVVDEVTTFGDRVRVGIRGELGVADQDRSLARDSAEGDQISLTAEITAAACASLDLALGSPCVGHVKATDVGIYPQ